MLLSVARATSSEAPHLDPSQDALRKMGYGDKHELLDLPPAARPRS